LRASFIEFPILRFEPHPGQVKLLGILLYKK
jgi:hypothetical protein